MQSGGPPCQLLKKFGKRGINIGEFFDIMGMAVDSSGNMYIVEWNNRDYKLSVTINVNSSCIHV